jgi:hypothetical protein
MLVLVREILVKLNSLTEFQVLLMSVAAVVFAAALSLKVLARWRRKTPEEIERLRRHDIHSHGRVAYGQIVDLIEPTPGKKGARMVIFKYEVRGVKYEAAQDISALPNIVAQVRQAVGQMARLKYDADRPTDSILACEEWSGLMEFAPKRKAQPQVELKEETN